MSVVSFVTIFSNSESGVLTLLIVSLVVQKLLSLIRFHLLYLYLFPLLWEVLFATWQIDGEIVEIVADFILGGSKITVDGDCSHEITDTYSLKRGYDQPRQHIKKQRNYFANKGPSSQGYGLSSSHVWM